jgi:hypothetical protein
VNTDGTVVPNVMGTGSNAFVSLDGFSFRTD